MFETILLLVRALVGMFFCISGMNKLADKERHQSLVRTLQENNIPFVGFNQYWVPAVEFTAGLAVSAGFLMPLPVLGLLVICIVACLTDGRKRIQAMQPINKADLLDDILYLPEVLYIILLVLLLAYGQITHSLDYHMGIDVMRIFGQ